MAPVALGRRGDGRPRVGASGVGWFRSAVRPDGPVGEYAAAPPRGMTNPPQNPLVQQALLKELMDYGIVLQSPAQWPPRPPLSSSPTPVGASSLPQLESMPGSRRAGTLLQGQGAPGAGLGRGSRTLAAAGSQSLPQLECAGGAAEGRRCRASQAAQAVLNQVSMEASRQWRGAPLLPKSSAGDSPLATAQQAASSSTARARAESDLAGCDTGRKSVDTASGVEKKHPAAFQQGMTKPDLSETEVQGAIDALRSRGRAHRVNVGKRFEQNADQASHAPSGSEWQSDGTYLQSHHNKAMRSHNPSRLDKLPKNSPKNQKKQKGLKKFVEEEAEEDSPHLLKYQSDTSLHALRDLRLKHFPPVNEVVIVGPTELEQKKIDLAMSFKELLGRNDFMKKFDDADVSPTRGASKRLGSRRNSLG